MDEAEWARNRAERRLELITAIRRGVENWAALHAVLERCASRDEAIEALGRPPLGFAPHEAMFVLDTPLRMCTPYAQRDLSDEIDRLRAELA